MTCRILLLIAGSLPGLLAYQAPAPCLTRPPADRSYTRVRLLEIVKNQTPVRAEYLIRACGVRVPLDGALEADLREAGAGDQVLAAVRAMASKTAAAPPAPVAAERKPDAHPDVALPPPVKGDTRTNPKDGLRYAFIPPGVFRMGCASIEGGGDCPPEEKPAHDVRITKGFWMGQTHVTVEAYRKFARFAGRPMPDEPALQDKRLNPSWNNEALPMTMVSWSEARDYCEWSGLRLPTEAEWEYAAGGGAGAQRYGELEDIAWWGGNSGGKPIDADGLLKSDAANYANRISDNGNRPHAVAQKRPNAFKLYDMLGNVWQWTSDWYRNGYEGEGMETDPQGPIGGEFRVLRGGSFFNESAIIRASYRGRKRPPWIHDFGNGFRCAGWTLAH